MAMAQTRTDDRDLFEATIRALQGDVTNAGAHLIIDAQVRRLYAEQIRAMAEAMRAEVERGRLTWYQAATQAQETRNVIMELMRRRSTPVGRAEAERLKKTGKTLNELIAGKTYELHGSGATFEKLTAYQKDQVYAEIVKSSGHSRPNLTARMSKLAVAGRGLIVLSLAVSVYNVANADDKVGVVKKEAAVNGAGIAGGIAGGALAGLACGPGAPACVVIGAFAGGALAAFGVDWFW